MPTCLQSNKLRQLTQNAYNQTNYKSMQQISPLKMVRPQTPSISTSFTENINYLSSVFKNRKQTSQSRSNLNNQSSNGSINECSIQEDTKRCKTMIDTKNEDNEINNNNFLSVLTPKNVYPSNEQIKNKRLVKIDKIISNFNIDENKSKKKIDQIRRQIQYAKQLLKIGAAKIDSNCLISFKKSEEFILPVLDILNSFLQLLNGLCLQVTSFKIVGEIRNYRRLTNILSNSFQILSIINKMDTIIEQNILPESNVKKAIDLFEQSISNQEKLSNYVEDIKVVQIKQFILRSIEYFYLNLKLKDLQAEEQLKPDRKNEILKSTVKNNRYPQSKSQSPVGNERLTAKKLLETKKTFEKKREMEIANKLNQWLSSAEIRREEGNRSRESADYESIQNQLQQLSNQKQKLRKELL